MKKKVILLIVGLTGVIILAFICAHSIEEIHYLKGFFTREFDTNQASLAASVELVKVVIIMIPMVLAYKVIKDFLGE